MCGRFTATAAFDVLTERFGITVEEGTHEELIARYNVAPFQTIPIVVNRWTRIPPMIARGRQLILAKWGFRPAWVTHGTLAPINARAETVAMSRLFGWALRDGRCIIPATWFYEWKPVPGQTRKQPYHVRLKGGGKVPERRLAVRKIANEIVDFREIALRSLGRYCRQGRHWQTRFSLAKLSWTA